MPLLAATAYCLCMVKSDMHFDYILPAKHRKLHSLSVLRFTFSVVSVNLAGVLEPQFDWLGYQIG